MPSELQLLDVCSTYPEHFGPNDATDDVTLGAALCDGEGGETGVLQCNGAGVSPAAFGAITQRPGIGDIQYCLLRPFGEHGTIDIMVFEGIPEAWRCINDVAALCRGLNQGP